MTGGLSYYGGKNPQRGIAHWIIRAAERPSYDTAPAVP